MPPLTIAGLCIFLLTTLHQYLNILYVSTQRYNSLGFKESEIGSKATKSSKEGVQLMATKKKAAKKKKKK